MNARRRFRIVAAFGTIDAATLSRRDQGVAVMEVRR
jgi:hypothetical protein